MSESAKHLVVRAGLAILVLGSLGCGSKSDTGPTVAIGRVTADGRPLSGAVLSIQPIGDTSGPNASSPVIDGEFEIGSHAGIHGGTYRVEISMLPEELLNQFPRSEAVNLPPSGSTIAADFDFNSKLQCELQPGQTNRLEFAVKFNRQR